MLDTVLPGTLWVPRWAPKLVAVTFRLKRRMDAATLIRPKGFIRAQKKRKRIDSIYVLHVALILRVSEQETGHLIQFFSFTSTDFKVYPSDSTNTFLSIQRFANFHRRPSEVRQTGVRPWIRLSVEPILSFREVDVQYRVAAGAPCVAAPGVLASDGRAPGCRSASAG
jgi:hypothetical protein